MLSMELLKKNHNCLRKTIATNWFEGCCWDPSRIFKILPPPRQSMLSMELLKKPPPAWGRPPLPIGLQDAAEISEETLKSPPPRQSMLSMELLKKTPPAWGRPPLRIGLKDAAEISEETFKIPPLPANQCFQWNYWRKTTPAWGRPPLRSGLKDAAEIPQQTWKSPPSPPINAFNGTTEETAAALGRPPLQIGLKDAAEISQETLKSPPLPANQCFQWNYSRNRPLFRKTTATNWFEGCCCDLSRNFKIPPLPAPAMNFFFMLYLKPIKATQMEW